MFEATINLAARLDSMDPEHPWAPSWAEYSRDPPPPDLTRFPAGEGFWRVIEWHPNTPEWYPPNPGRWWEAEGPPGSPMWLNPMLLDPPSAYGPRAIPIPHVAAVRALELDARAWERYADKEISPKTLAHQARKARQHAVWHRKFADLIQFNLDRFGEVWKADIEDLNVLPLKKPIPKPRHRPVLFKTGS